MWIQRRVRLSSSHPGWNLVTSTIVEAVPEIAEIEAGLLHVFLQHTSASLSLNENADPDVPRDLERVMAHLAPESFDYTHTMEGPDDMPAHVKTSLLGASVSVPVGQGRLLLGTWQGIYLCEHRRHPSARNAVITLMGQRRGGDDSR